MRRRAADAGIPFKAMGYIRPQPPDLPFLFGKEELVWEAGEGSARIRGKKGSCGINQIEGKADADFIYCEPNVNLLYPRTVLPCLQMTVRPGINIVEYRIEGEMNTD